MQRRRPRQSPTRPARHRRRALAPILALLLTLAAATATAGAQSTSTESGNPINDQGSSYHFRSYITGVEPAASGLSIQVLQFADRLELINHTGKTVTVYGYEGEPYAQVLADGTVRVNTHSPAFYLNQAFYANVTVPPYATPKATPQWTVIDSTGRLEWHDHRIHWMSPVVPPEVKDQGKLTKIFNWKVPISVGTTPGTVQGELFWVPESGSKTPTAAIAVLAVLIVLSVIFVLYVRRRRSRAAPPGGPADVDGAAPPPAREVW